MSSNPIPVSEAGSPFQQRTTPQIERANRLIGLRAHPGFLDLVRISQEMVQESVDATSDYPGWDPQVMMVLKVKQQAAKEHHQALLTRLQNAIQAGLDEAKEMLSTLPAPTVQTATEILEQGDYVRQAVLQNFEDRDVSNDSRTAGSYNPDEEISTENQSELLKTRYSF